MEERPRGLSRTASMPMNRAVPAAGGQSVMSSSVGTDRGSSIFSSWRRRLSKRGGNGEQLEALEGKELRDAVWRQQQHEQQQGPAQVATRKLRVIRYTPVPSAAAPGKTEVDDEEDEEVSVDDDISSNGSARGVGPMQAYNYDVASPNEAYNPRRPIGNSKSSRSARARQSEDSMATSRLSLTLSRLSLSSSASATIADYKARKYDVAWKKDTEVLDCQVCHLAFTKWSRRRHHCRVCGDIICDDCSPDQAHIVGRFTRPKRCCTACFTLFEAMMHTGDPQVKLFMEQEPGSKDWVNLTPSNTLDDSASPAIKYHDRLAEIQRVTTAGMKARRAGGGRFCVISAQWLRSWLAFTRSHDAGNSNGVDGSDDMTDSFHRKRDRAHSANSMVSADGADGGVPGAIDNLALLVVKKGFLVPRDGLIKCENQAFTDGETQVRGDYQVIPVEVWDVLFRYYGGGPRIEIATGSGEEGDQWVIDVASVLSRARTRKATTVTTPGAPAPPLTIDEKIIERALTERHDPLGILLDDGVASSAAMSRSNHRGAQPGGGAASSRPPPFARSVSDSLMGGSATSVQPKFSRSAGVASRNTKPEPPVVSSQRQVRDPRAQPLRSPPGAVRTPPQPPRSQPRREIEPDTEPEPKGPSDARSRGDTIRNERSASRDQAGSASVPRRDAASENEPTAASAASAFALAMKEARLKQQRAIAGSSRSTPSPTPARRDTSASAYR